MTANHVNHGTPTWNVRHYPGNYGNAYVGMSTLLPFYYHMWVRYENKYQLRERYVRCRYANMYANYVARHEQYGVMVR